MKKIILLTVIASAIGLMSQSARADRIILKNGDVLDVFNVEVGSNSVYYTLTTEDSNTQKVKKSEVFGVKIGDGEMQTLGDATSAPVAPAAGGPVEIKKAPADNNADILASYSANQYYVKGKKKNNKTAKSAILIFRFTDNSILSNEDIDISFEPGIATKTMNWTPLMQAKLKDYPIHSLEVRIHVTNKTDKVLYFDLANCARTSDIKGYHAFYDGTQTYESLGQSSGVGVNLGAVAGAVGIGGAVGILASGVSVGGGNSTTSTILKGQQRIMAIPPHSTVVLPPEMKYNKTLKENLPYYESFSEYQGIASFADKLSGIKEYDNLIYSEKNTPARVNYIFTYSDCQDFAVYVQSHVGLYVSAAIPAQSIQEVWAGITGTFTVKLDRIPNIDSKAIIGQINLCKNTIDEWLFEFIKK